VCARTRVCVCARVRVCVCVGVCVCVCDDTRFSFFWLFPCFHFHFYVLVHQHVPSCGLIF
jgi:hypothetical protein